MLNKLRCILQRKSCRCMDRYDINIEQLQQMVQKGAILVDVRSPQEYEEGHLENSVLIPEYEMKSTALKIIPDKNQLIIVYCSSGIRSKKAQRILWQMGYTQIYNLYQGLC